MLSSLAWSGVGGEDEDEGENGEQVPSSREMRESRRCGICIGGG